MIDEIASAESEFRSQIEAADDAAAVERVRVAWFGRKGGKIPALFSRLREVPAEDKRAVGDALNRFRQSAEELMRAKQESADAAAAGKKKAVETLDVTLPGREPAIGHLHPVTLVRREIEAIFREMGYTIESGPEIDTDWYNFEALNFTPDHPARDEQDTFYVSPRLLLRTHTSNTQIHALEMVAPPLRVLSAGRVYRRDEITLRRSPMFHQVEGFLVDRGIHFGHLKGTLEHFLRRFFDESLEVRFRPSYFPFTEPSAEVDMSCVFCKGKGCGTCSQTGWMEILGCGMIHPNELRNVGLDPDEWSGFAFGAGLDRMAMLKYDIPNIRVLFENDLRVLQQF